MKPFRNPRRHLHARRSFRGLALAACVSLGAVNAGAVLLLGTADPKENTQPPTGALANSGWQYLGTWGGTIGTAISPSHFITAKHVGGSVGGTFTLGGIHYTVTESFDSPDSDLRIWKVDGKLPAYASLYSGSDEVGKSQVVFGRGPARSDIVIKNSSGEPAGWLVGAGAGTLRWGENVVSSVVSRPGLGELLRTTFDRNGGPNEAMLGDGDSGGAVFVQEGGIWKLAGINYGVSGPYSELGGNPGFFGAVYDTGGLFGRVGSGWVPLFNFSLDIPAYYESTRISANQEWIQGVLAVPEPGTVVLFSGAGLAAFAAIRSELRRRTAQGGCGAGL